MNNWKENYVKIENPIMINLINRFKQTRAITANTFVWHKREFEYAHAIASIEELENEIESGKDIYLSKEDFDLFNNLKKELKDFAKLVVEN